MTVVWTGVNVTPEEWRLPGLALGKEQLVLNYVRGLVASLDGCVAALDEIAVSTSQCSISLQSWAILGMDLLEPRSNRWNTPDAASGENNQADVFTSTYRTTCTK